MITAERAPATRPHAPRRVRTGLRFSSAGDFREHFKAHYGPTVAVYRSLAEAPDRAAALDADLADLARAHDVGGGGLVMDSEYLLVTARRT